MTNKKNVLVFLNLCFVFFANAQDSTNIRPKNCISVQFGYSTHIVKDDLISPLTYRGNCVPIALNYNYRGNKNRHNLLMSYQNLELSSSISYMTDYFTHYATDNIVLLEYTYSRKVLEIKQFNIDFYLGGEFLSIYNYRNYYYLKDKNAESAEQHTSLGVDALLEKRFGERRDNYLGLNLSIPLLSYSILNERFNANVSTEFDNLDLNKNIYWQIFKDGNIVTVNKLFEFQTELAFTKFLNKHFGFEIKYKLHYYVFDQYKNLLRVKYLNNQFLFGLILRI